ncbi:lipopolysaccharide biosynthesis glycosyltransferase [Hymenobacter luteus]|uniref:Lipopolysaccharide biosynthesis glycosyltransferase n=2 Tax=Hymenobacter TaxID=89966 RepID=A0A7W9T1E1_9BACT|nr:MULTISPECIES: glycosyltransferase family 8 protein [Hymenobacter]MBB4600603.1 lipopolysaccharide biosynthesis glycosyltransferase [Hymenobacter latericoloratus]MBB6059190.1 lipopolysaccharide biosynthesis glycosyltransferase [Hymenobacter luteus]
MSTPPVIHLGFCFDKGYLPPFYVLLTSIFYHNSAHNIVIHAIATNISETDKSGLVRYAKKHGAEIFFYTVEPHLVQDFVLPDHAGSYFTETIFYRLFFAKLVPPSVESIIYMDIDTIVVGDLSPLSHLDTGEHPLAAVADDWMPIREDLGITQKGQYFNSGVTLINIHKWNEKNVTERVTDVIIKYPERIKQFPDQDALNMVLLNDWYKLSVGYNLTGVHCPSVTDRAILDEYLKDKTIIHFSGPKPWNVLTDCNHVYEYKWFEYYNISPVKSFVKYFDIKLSKSFIKKFTFKHLLKFYLNTPILGKIKRAISSGANQNI